MQKLWQFCRENFLFLLGVFFVVFIPLFPKRPLLDVVGTWVDVRLEDFLVSITYAILGFQFLRKRNIFKTPLTLPITLYWIVGLLALINSLIFIGPYLPGFFPKVATLYYLRGIEYMGMFFLGFWALRKTDKQLPILITFLALTVFSVFIYGVGQKYKGWPAFSTMNEEFAKGIPLKLPPTARVMSTFAGHYDLAAYLVLVIPILGSMIFVVKNKFYQLLLLATTVCAFVLLLFTASRISFGVYLITMSAMLWWQKKRWLIIPVVIVSIIAVNFVSGASERFLKTFRYDDVIVDLSTGKPIGTLEKLEGGNAVLQPIASPDQENLPKGSGYINAPISGTTSGTIKTVELVKKKNLASGSGDVATVSGSFLVQKAFVLDISITTRFQGEWPHAIEAFKRNVLLGSGFSSISLATDGNYHRLLGETGLLGAVSFLGIFIFCFYWFFKKKHEMKGLEKAFIIGVFAGVVGLLFNAILIDVFQASKVAFTLWLLIGFAMAILSNYPLGESYADVLRRFFVNKKAFVIYLFIAVFMIYGDSISHYFIGDDFTWLRWAAESKISSIPGFFTSAAGFFYRPIPKLWYFALFTVFWLIPQAYHVASIGLFGLSALLLISILGHFRVNKMIIFLLICFYLTMSIHHESLYWISNHSHLLGYTSLLGSIYIFISYWSGKLTRRFWYLIGALLLVISLFSYDIMVVAPFMLILFGGVIYKKWNESLPFLLLIPVYLLLRSFSGAVPPSGDYGYNLAHLIPNVVANSLGYTLSIIVGPKAIEVLTVLREQFRSQIGLFTIFGGLASLGVIGFIYSNRKKLFRQQLLVVLFCCYILSLIMYLGLGGIAERYSLYASGFFILFTGILLDQVWKKFSSVIIKSSIVVIIVLLSLWNYSELKRLGKEWKFASHVTETTLQIMKKNFFPLTEHKTFIYVNTPTRYGRAWIFPTGLNDALWHMYRQSPFDVVQLSSDDAAFAYPQKKDSAKIIFEFDQNYNLQQVVKEEQKN